MRPLCFVLMPFGKKRDEKNREIDFDVIYAQLIRPVIEAAGMEPVRADEEMVGGIIHKPMYERLLMCDYAIADLTTANANVFYELGVRHAARPFSTLAVFAGDCTLPFDVHPLRAYPYGLDDKRFLNKVDADKANITKWLNSAREKTTDSPLYQFFDELQPHTIPHEKTDVFRDRVKYSNKAKKRLETLRLDKDLAGLKAFEAGLDTNDTEGGVFIDLFLSYRTLEAWDEMVALVDTMPEHLIHSLLVREQLGLALNRAGESQRAEIVLTEAIEVYGDSSETLGILGRVYKDRWKSETDPLLKEALLKQAIDTYIKGFETDWRDAYPGINAITLMLTHPEPDLRLEELIVVVGYAVKRKVALGEGDYWDHATLMELAVVARKSEEAHRHLLKALPKADDAFMPETTAATLKMLRARWSNTGEETAWMTPFLEALRAKHEELSVKEKG